MREMLYGRQAVRESLRAGRRSYYQLTCAKGIDTNPIIDDIMDLAHQHHIPVHNISRQEMTNYAHTSDHQGVVLDASGYPYVRTDAILDLAEQRGEALLILLLDLIQDVHNMGSLIRTAEATGVHGVIIQDRRAAGITPATVNASSGAAEHLLISSVTNLAQEIERIKDAEVWVAGLEEHPDAERYTDIDMTGALGLVVGSEGSGLRRLVQERCDWLLSIPMRGKINSLNAAVAGSIALYEAYNQRQRRS